MIFMNLALNTFETFQFDRGRRLVVLMDIHNSPLEQSTNRDQSNDNTDSTEDLFLGVNFGPPR